MKNTIEFTSKSNNDYITIAMKKSRFPWWILLLLIPLILLIPIKRDLHCQLMENGTLPIAQAQMQCAYFDVGIFAAHTPRLDTKVSDNEGKFSIVDISEPLWYYLFVDAAPLLLTGGNGCATLAGKAIQYKEFHRGQYKVIDIPNSVIAETEFTVINKKTLKPIPDAKVELILTHNGQSTTQEYTSDENGKVVIKDVSSCYSVKITASKKNYTPDSRELGPGQLASISDDDKILRLRPLEGKDGDLRINLQWNCKADLDLMVYDPCGQCISFSQRKMTCNGNVGELDVDANFKGDLKDDPQENIFWKKASPGKYYVLVVGWDHKGRTVDYEFPIEFNVSVILFDDCTDISGTYPKEKLQHDHMTSDIDMFKVYEFEIPED